MLEPSTLHEDIQEVDEKLKQLISMKVEVEEAMDSCSGGYAGDELHERDLSVSRGSL